MRQKQDIHSALVLIPAPGAVAGVSEILVMYPLDVVKTRVWVFDWDYRQEEATDTGPRQLQSGTAIGEEGYNGMVDCFRKIIRNEGFVRRRAPNANNL